MSDKQMEISISCDNKQKPLTPDQVERIIGIVMEQDETPEKPTVIDFELPDGEWHIYGDGEVATHRAPVRSSYTDAGATRVTKEQAELGRDRMVRSNRLSALAAALDGEREFTYGQNNYFIYLNGKEWSDTFAIVEYEPEKVYMTEDCAERICKMLNNGEFSL